MPGIFPLNTVPRDFPYPHPRSQFRTRDGEQQRLLNAAERTPCNHAHAFSMPRIIEIDAADNATQGAKEQAIDSNCVPGVLSKQKPIPLSPPFRAGTLIAASPESGRADGPRMRCQVDPHHAGDMPQPPLTRTIAEASGVECRGMSGESERVRGLIARSQPPQRTETETANDHPFAPGWLADGVLFRLASRLSCARVSRSRRFVIWFSLACSFAGLCCSLVSTSESWALRLSPSLGSVSSTRDTSEGTMVVAAVA